ncbi:MAG: DEAD/DEAH box helicase, partial [Mariprofundaceae bacterium]|nr:DEAD/DEAH box helicase [Mariprofundaceae bacterium]
MYQALTQPIGIIPGIGPALEKRMRARGIGVLGDLLLHIPREYMDDRIITPIALLPEGETVRIQGRIVDRSARGYGRKKQVVIRLADESGGMIELRFFHSGYMMTDARLAEGQTITVRGMAERWGRKWQMAHPDWMVPERFRPGWRPVYGSLAGLSGKRVAGLIEKAVTYLPAGTKSPLDAVLPEYPPLREALCRIHQGGEESPLAGANRAWERLRLEELLVYLHLMQEKRRQAAVAAPVLSDNTLCGRLLERLPYPLTEAQQQVWQEIAADMESGRRMHRLLQGDVGAGKTWIAALCIARTAAHGMQAALMAPTEVLAAQHAETLRELLSPVGLDVTLLTGSTKAAERRRILQGLAEGNIRVVVGTHALISDDVHYARLGLAIVDEQHRFGVRQRWALAE